MILNHKGLTLVEVLMALAIFTISYLVIVDAQNMSVRNTAHSERMTMATILAQKKMTEVLLKYRGKPVSEIPDEETGKFEGEFKKFIWEETSRDFDYDLSFLKDMVAEKEGKEKKEQSPLLGALPKMSDFIKNATKEITVTVYWKEGKNEYKTSITTHVFNFNAPIGI